MRKASLYTLIIILSFLIPTVLKTVQGATVEDLQQKIQSNSTSIQQLQKEIDELSNKLGATTAQKKTLQNAINALELNSKKLQAQIDVTQKKIGSTNIQIQQLGLSISDKQKHIEKNKQALAENLKGLNESDSQSLIETMLIYPNLSEFSSQVETLNQFQTGVKTNLDDLQELKKGLVVNQQQTVEKKDELVSLKDQLTDQNTVIEVNKTEKAKILTQTKSQESAYQKMLADKKAKEKAFEDELNAYQSQLHLLIDPASIPGAKAGLLAWPLSTHRITQFFGNTEFAQQHAAVYNGNGHNGIDIAASIGTPIMSAGVGTVQGTGNTDLTCPGASFGKWVMVKHNNGLSTLYAHLSVIKAVKGQQVNTGDILGYSGETGYATGPHLHFTVYASQGVEILSRASKSCDGATYTMPIADLKAYLNPLSYLPS